ncbi:MAG: respiratory nitrate reductase subunit gamma [Desulfomonile sp.]|nr:respiratory nitrate reductase subunit gamma [Desulfomonile sp.]
MFGRIWYFVMVPMVYLAFVWCVLGIAFKTMQVLRAPRLPRTLRIFPESKSPDDRPIGGWAAAVWDTFAMPTLWRFNPTLWFFLVVFHIGIVILIISHLDLLPQVNIVSASSPHMIGNGTVGAAVTVALLYLLFRRFRGTVREVSVLSDYLLLFLLLCTVVSGDIISWGNSWSDEGFVMTKQDLGKYLESLITFSFTDPRKFLSGSHYPVIGFHVLCANLFLMVLPFSKLVHTCFALPMNKLRRG